MRVLPSHVKRVVGAATLLGFALAGSAAQAPPLGLPPGFRAEIVTEGLGAPRALALDPAGALLVSIPSQGRIVALDVTATGPREAATVVAGLNLPHGMAIHRDSLYVAETGRILRFRYDTRARTAREPVVVVPDLPAGAHHWTRAVAIAHDGRLVVAIGSSCDVCREADRRRAAIVGYAADGSHERLLATGLRNPVGLAFHPRTGVLWTTVNERDWRSGGAPPDYVTAVREGDAFGWPDCYAERGAFAKDPELAAALPCRGLTPPTLELPPHAAPLGLAFYTGRRFPPSYQGNLFVALHGSRPGLPAAGYKLIRVVLEDGRRPRVEDFATRWRDGDRVWGRPVDLLVGADGALYVSDDHGGRIIRISALRPGT